MQKGVNMRRYSKVALLIVASLLGCALTGAAAPLAEATSAGSIVFSGAPGTSAPPATLGPYSMTPFAADPQAVGASVSSVTGPTGALAFSPSLEHCLTPNPSGCWQTWSNGYSGDVYATGSESVTLTLPAGTQAFYFYAEPDEFMTFSMTATTSSGTTSGAIPVAGFAGAQYFGFYSTGSAPLATITVSGGDPAGFAVGEFGVSNGSEHFVVNTEAWIPFPAVVDPYLPLPTSYEVTQNPFHRRFDPNCYTLPANTPWQELLGTTVSSTYGGDSHTGFGGTYRLRTEVSFDFNPATDSITNFTEDAVPSFGTSHRYKVYTYDGAVLATCTQAANTMNKQTAQLTSGTEFEVGYRGTNPLAQPYAPELRATMNGTLAQDGSLTLTYTTTEFPSQGIQVSVNGNLVATDLENDVSCLGASGVLGFPGLLRIGAGLSVTESGSVTIEPTGSMSESTPSPLCRTTTGL
jgi:hypothetical protein